jgi:segregation and condensation protein B
VLTTLLEKKLVTTAGRKAVVGTPFLYRTTRDFLVRFGLNELTDLPKPEELDEDLATTVEAAPEAGVAPPDLPVPSEDPLDDEGA